MIGLEELLSSVLTLGFVAGSYLFASAYLALSVLVIGGWIWMTLRPAQRAVSASRTGT